MIENYPQLLDETLIPVKQTASLLPVPKSIPTINHWITTGCYGKKLQTVKIGGRRYTSKEALSRFLSDNSNTTTLELPPKPMPDTLLNIKAKKLGLVIPN
jgi:hypothetical protein